MRKIFVFVMMLLLVSCNNGNVEENNGVSIDNNKSSNAESVVENENGLDLMEVTKLMNDGKYSEAEQLLLKIEKKDEPEVLKLFGKIKFSEKKYEEALKYYLKANTIQKSKNSDTLYLVGVVYDNLGDKEKAKEFVEKSLKVNPDSKVAKEYLNTFQGNNEEEDPNLQALIEVTELIEEGKNSAAEKLLSKIDDQNDSEVLKSFGKLKFSEEKYTEALEYYFKANTIEKSINPDTLYLIGVIYDNLGDKTKAKEFVEKSLKIKPDYEFAIAYLKTFKEDSFGNNSDEALSQESLDIIKLIDDGKYSEAEKLLSKINDKNDPEVLKLYGRIKFLEEEYAEALEYYLDANTIQKSNNSDTLYIIGVIYDNLGDREKTKVFVEKSLKVKPDFELAKEYLKLLNGVN